MYLKKEFMKQKFVFMMLVAAAFTACNKEEVKQEVNKPVPGGKTQVVIEGDVIDPPADARSTSSTVYFTGGTATGAGLYISTAKPTVAAYPNEGYEIDFFYGGAENASTKTYDYAQSGQTSFQVNLQGRNHYFKCSFKEKKRTLTLVANPAAGGTVTGGGTYKVKKDISITAAPKPGYTFTGWTVTSGDAKIANASSASTTASLQSSNSTLQANFKKNEIIYSVKIKRDAQTTGVGESYTCTAKYEASVTSSDNSKASVSFVLHGIERQWTEDNGTTTWEQTDDVSTSGEPIVEDWCDGSNGIYSYSSISWTGYTVTVNGHTISSSTFKSASFEIAGGKISVII